jgi:hypothetical protein
LNRKQFRQSLYKGLGRALLYLKEHPSKTNKYTDIIYSACIYNTKYDSQSEQSRAKYLLEVINLSQGSEILQAKILVALKQHKNKFDSYQIYELIRHFAEGGNFNAREVMKQEFTYSTEYDSFIGAEEIIELEDISGLIFVADIIGKKMNDDSSYSGELFLPDFIIEKYGDEVISRLIAENKVNKNVVTFLEDVLRHKDIIRPSCEKIEPYFEIKEMIENNMNMPLYKFMAWGRHATIIDLEMAANDLLSQYDKQKLVKYLYIFRGRAFPIEPTKIIELAKSDNEEICEAAVVVLSKIKDDRIHELVVDILKEKPNRNDIIRLLELNYFDDDFRLIEHILDMKNNKHDVHDVGLAIISVFQSNQTKNCQKIMEKLYEKTYCSVCRESIIDIMIENKIIPLRILDEAKYDCNFDIRQMVNEYISHGD